MKPLALIDWIWYTWNQGETLIRFFPLLVNWLMGEISTYVKTMTISFCKPIWNLKTINNKIGATMLHEHIFRISLFWIFSEKNRFENARLAWKTLYKRQVQWSWVWLRVASFCSCFSICLGTRPITSCGKGRHLNENMANTGNSHAPGTRVLSRRDAPTDRSTGRRMAGRIRHLVEMRRLT